MTAPARIRLHAGDRFRVVRGSRAGGLGVTGSLDVEQFDGDLAVIAISVGKFGFNIGATLRMQRSGDTFEFVASGRTFEPLRRRGTVAVDEPDELRIVEDSGELADLRFVLGDGDDASLEAEIPNVGEVHLLLEATA